MLISMTGFGRAILDSDFGRIIVEIQSVNRKYLEMNVLLPKDVSRYEMEIRKWVNLVISRGQLTIRVFFIPSDESLSELLPDPKLLKQWKDGWTQVAKKAKIDTKTITLPFLIENLPSSLLSNRTPDEKLLDSLKDCLEQALKELGKMKRTEGQALTQDISGRLKDITKKLKKIEELSPQSVVKQREKLRERLLEVLQPGSELDERLLREIAIFADKVDIAEEIARLSSHISQFQEILKTTNEPVGRKLDFLVQELGREMNTIASKSAEAEITHLVVEMKSELEKIREQIQNIE